MSPSLPLILANSFECGWQGVNLILEREVQGEIPGAEMNFHQKFHFITIALEPVRASYKNLDAALTIAELSEVVNLSTHHFSELFRKTIGLTPHQYVIKIQIERAMVLLQSTQLPIVTIAQQVGFQTQSHFTRIFRQHTQVTPKQYRDQF